MDRQTMECPLLCVCNSCPNDQSAIEIGYTPEQESPLCMTVNVKAYIQAYFGRNGGT